MNQLGQLLAMVLQLPRLVVLSFLVLLIFYRFVIYRLFISPLAKIPGPKRAAITTSYMNYHWYRESAPQLIAKLHVRYGPIVRVGPSEVVINDPSQLQTIYGARSSMTKCPSSTMFGHHTAPNTYSSVTKEEHSMRKKNIAPVFSAANLWSNEKMQNFLQNRLRKVQNAAEKAAGGTLDIFTMSYYFAVDNITYQVHGESFNLLEGHNVRHAKNITALITGATPMWRLRKVLSVLSLPPLRFLLPGFVKQANQSQTELEQMNLRQIEKMVNIEDAMIDPKTFILSNLRSNARKDLSLTPNHIASECMDNFIAGTDAIAAAITYLLYELAKPENEKYQSRLQRELQTLSDLFEFKDILKLPFLDILLQESMRYSTPAPGSLQQRYTTEHTQFTVRGKNYVLPPGTVVSSMAYTMHQSEEYFGADAKCFRPERWETEDIEQLQKMKDAWFPFGTGTRACGGQPLALLEVKAFVVVLLFNRRISLPANAKPEDMIAHQGAIIRPRAGRCDLAIEQL